MRVLGFPAFALVAALIASVSRADVIREFQQIIDEELAVSSVAILGNGEALIALQQQLIDEGISDKAKDLPPEKAVKFGQIQTKMSIQLQKGLFLSKRDRNLNLIRNMVRALDAYHRWGEQPKEGTREFNLLVLAGSMEQEVKDISAVRQAILKRKPVSKISNAITAIQNEIVAGLDDVAAKKAKELFDTYTAQLGEKYMGLSEEETKNRITPEEKQKLAELSVPVRENVATIRRYLNLERVKLLAIILDESIQKGLAAINDSMGDLTQLKNSMDRMLAEEYSEVELLTYKFVQHINETYPPEFHEVLNVMGKGRTAAEENKK